jgi:hypothetical protein
MGALKELFGSFEGQLSLLVILTVIVMAIYYVRLFVKNIQLAESEKSPEEKD